jgi:hypothetical protein
MTRSRCPGRGDGDRGCGGVGEELATKPTLQESLSGYMERRYERCKSLVEIAQELARGEMENDHTVDVPGLTVKSMHIVAAPI